MGILETALDPWGRTVLTHVAWNILWVSVYVFITFLVAHASYIILSAHRVRARADPGVWGFDFEYRLRVAGETNERVRLR